MDQLRLRVTQHLPAVNTAGAALWFEQFRWRWLVGVTLLAYLILWIILAILEYIVVRIAVAIVIAALFVSRVH